MAKIPQYVSGGGVSTQPSQNYIPRMGADGSELLGQAVAGFGRDLQQTGNILQQQERQKQVDADRQAEKDRIAADRAERIQKDSNSQWALNATVRYKTNVAEQTFAAQEQFPENGMYADGSSYSDGIQNLNKTVRDEIAESAPNPEAAEFFKNNSYAFSEDSYLDSLKSEAKERYRYSVQSVVTGAELDINLIVKRPDQLAATWLARKESIDTISTLGPAQKAELISKISPAYAMLPIQRDLNEAKLGQYPAEQIIKDINSGAYEAKLAKIGLTIKPDELQGALDKAIALSKVKNTEAYYEQDKVRDDIIATAAETGVAPDEGTLDQFSVRGSAYVGELKDRAGLAADASKGLKQIAIDPVGFRDNMLPKVANVTGPGAAKAAKLQGVFTTAVNQEIAYMQANPGDAGRKWLTNISKSTNVDVEKAMFTAIGRAGTLDGEINLDSRTGQMDPRSEASLSLAYQRSQGISTLRQEVLGGTVAKEMVQKLTTKDPLDMQGSYVKVQQGLAELKNTYQEYYPKVMQELVKAGLSQEFEVLALAQGTVLANKMTAALQTKSDVIEKNLGFDASKIRSVKENVAGLFGPYTKALAVGAPLGERAGFINTIKDVAYRMTITELSSNQAGKSPSEISARIYKELITDQMSVTDTLIVPKVGVNGKPQDINVIQGNLDAHKRYLTVDKIKGDYKSLGANIPLASRKKAELDVIKRDGYWITNSSGTGAYLAISNSGYDGVPVIGANGQKIEFKYTDLMDPKHKLPSNMNVRKQEQFFPMGDNVNSL